MKKITAMFLVIVMAVSLAACGKSAYGVPSDIQKQVDAVVEDLTGTGENVTGGWEKAETSDLSDEQKAIFDKATAASDGQYTPLALEATQVVAGMNYCFLCKNEKDGRTEYRLLYIYGDLEGNATITEIQSFGDRR